MTLLKPGLIALVAMLAAPAVADDPDASGREPAQALAESRLHGCLLAGSTAAPDTGLRDAIISVRAFCGAQLNRVRDLRVESATAGLRGAQADAARDQAIRGLNDEIARTIANFTGLTD